MIRKQKRTGHLAGLSLAGVAAVSGLLAGAAAAPAARFELGSRTVAYAEPLVPRPPGPSCVVTLFANEVFDTRGNSSSMASTPHRFHFAPPAACPGAWSKVVLDADFSVASGRQFDRTAEIWLGGVNLYFGTTYEPSPGVAQHWRVERDLTDYASLFRQVHDGQVILNNQVARTYTTSPIHGSARLVFYPASGRLPAAPSADRVYAFSADPVGEETALPTAADSLSRSFVFPRNVDRAYLDVIAQSQANDERWYGCVDDKYLAQTRAYSLEAFEACDGGSFREIEVLVDDVPAGLAPVYPWIYTGGLAPHLWLPTPGIQTLNFIPFRVNLTPFAGLLDNGRSHTIAVRVLGANHFFNVAANLLVYLDHDADRLEGAVVRNTLAGSAGVLTPTVHSTLHQGQDEAAEGAVDTDLKQHYIIVGSLHTPRGVEESTVSFVGGFHNHQTFQRPGEQQYQQRIDQLTSASETDTRSLDGLPLEQETLTWHFPLQLDVHKTMRTWGQNFTALVALRQGYDVVTDRSGARGSHYHASLQDQLSTRVRANGPTIPDPLDGSRFDYNERGWQQVTFTDSLGNCYRTRLVSHGERLFADSEGTGCPGGVNQLSWRARPGAPRLTPLYMVGGRAAATTNRK